jgi:eukaryotic-like serine/threonine-protein kinase
VGMAASDVRRRSAAATWGLEEGDRVAPDVYVVSPLGGGPRYEAHLAWDDRRLTLVVAKVLRPDAAGDPRARRQIAAEADALRALQHPVLPRCFDASLDGDRPYLLLEFLDGPRLSTLIRKQGKLAIEQALPLALQLCSALHFMAREGWVHRDVKPKNVVMGGPPRLIDLSIAIRDERISTIGEPVGTDAYMAPEQCDRFEEIAAATDVWGLGVTAYQGIEGRLPYPRGRADAEGAERFPQLVHPPEPMGRDVPPQVAEPIMRCLAPRPEDRPTATELASELEVLVNMLPKPSFVPRMRPRTRR